MKRGFLWSTAGFLGSKLLTFGSTIVLARLIAPADFGVVAAVLAFIGLIELISDLGLGAAVIYEQEEGVTERTQTAFTLNILVSVVLAVVAVALAPLAASALEVHGHDGLFRLAALSLLFTGLGNVQDSLLLRELAFRRRIVAELTRSGVRTAVSVVLAAVGLGATGLVVGMLAGGAAWLGVQWVLTAFRPTFALDRSVAAELVRYGGAASLLELLAAISSRVDVVVIARTLGEGALGLYTVAFRLPEMAINTVAWNLSLVAFPALSRQRATDRAGMARTTVGLVRYQALYALPVATGMAVLAPSIIVTLFGTRWRDAAGVLAAVAVMTTVHAIAFPLGDVFKATGRQRIMVAINLVSLPIAIVAMAASASSGIVAVAWSRAGTQTLFAVMLSWLAAKEVGIGGRHLAAAIGPGLAASVGVAVGAGAVQLGLGGSDWTTAVAGAAAGGVGGVAALRTLSPAAWADALGLVASVRGRRVAAGPPA